MTGLHKKLSGLLEPVINTLGFELIGVEYVSKNKSNVLVVYIDKPEGINVDDCATVSHQVSGLLDIEDPIKGRYQLEISSPGLDRPLFKPDHFKQCEGQVARVQLFQQLDGRRNFKGVIDKATDTEVLIEIDGEDFELPYIMIEKARIVADL